MIKMKYCTRCVYPEAAVNLSIDEHGICSSCRFYEKYNSITEKQWLERRNIFEKTLTQKLKDNKSNYDVLIPVSGGKDSYFQTHTIISEFNLKPLLVTYHGNNYLPEGDINRDNMRHVFNADHIVWGPSIEVLKKLNRLGFKKMGDMNWQNHCGIFSAPVQMAAKFKIPFIIWGDINWDISGMFEPNDFVEFSARTRHEHDLRGFEYYDFINDKDDNLTEKDMNWAKYPSDEEILETEIRGLFLGNYFKWDANKHMKDMINLYSWKPSPKPHERTFRNFSNLDDRYENGIHDLLKFYKFGYGRASDHASKDIRGGYMSRDEGIEMVRKYEDVVSSDLYYWLDYVEMTEQQFFNISDTFRDPRVWTIKDDCWWKDNVWGEFKSYGKVHLSKDQKEVFLDKQKKLKI